jgi:hypothetical protein
VEVFYMLDSNQSNNIHGETLALSHDNGAYPFQSIEIRHLKNGRDSNTHVLAHQCFEFSSGGHLRQNRGTLVL